MSLSLTLLVGCALLAVLATTLLGEVACDPMSQPASAAARSDAPSARSHGLAALGRGSAIRNLVF